MPLLYFSLGSNQGDRILNLRAAVSALVRIGIEPIAVSPVYESRHVGELPASGPVPNYLNCVVSAYTLLDPDAVLHTTQEIENEMGHPRDSRWLPRNIDIDILLYGNQTIQSSFLTIPHPRLCERAFVVVPLLEIAPEVRLPDGRWVKEIALSPSIRLQSLTRIDDAVRIMEQQSR